MAKKSKTQRPDKILQRNGEGGATAVKGETPGRVSKKPISEGHDLKYWKKVMVMTPQGFKKAKWVRKASKSDKGPPSVLSRGEERAKMPPAEKYASKKKKKKKTKKKDIWT